MDRIRSTIAFGVMSSLASAACAMSIMEIGDAGDLPATAQVTAGVGPVTSISGLLQSGTDVDMYELWVAGSGAVTLASAVSTSVDTQLFLFNLAGFAVVGNDDLPTTLDALISTTVAPGRYFLAIGSWDRDPVNAAGQEIFNDVAGAQQMPINGGGPIAGYTGIGGIGTYTINTSGVSLVPEPAAWLLLGLGIPALRWRQRLQRRRTA